MLACIKCSEEISLIDYISDISEGFESLCNNCNSEIVELDDSIAYTIIELNKKGYKTKYCCGGHVTNAENFGNGRIPVCIYIMFERDVKIPYVPVGCIRKSDNILSVIIKDEDMKSIPSQLLLIANKKINLYNWGKELPDSHK